MKKLILLFLFLPLFLMAEYSVEQEKIIEKVFKLAQPFNLSYSVLAITAIESDFGKYPINVNDPSCGITHISLKTYMKRHKIVDTPFNRNKICADLISSDELSIANTIEELLYWQSIYCKNGKCTTAGWLNVWSSYNCGFKNTAKQCLAYANKVNKLVQKFVKELEGKD